MRNSVVYEAGPTDFRLGPAERVAQKGADATTFILAALTSGMGLTPKRRVLVVDANPDHGWWCDGVWKLQKQWSGSNDVPFFAYMTYFKTEDAAQRSMMDSRVQGKLLSEWWDTQGVAGAPEPVSEPDQFVEKPSLTLLTWENGSAVIPAVVLAKFPESDTDYHAAWTTFCTSANVRLDAMKVRAIANNSPAPLVPPMITGPDWSHGSVAPDTRRALTSPEVVAFADFDHMQTCETY
jgi:hypothetical protein